MEALRKAWWLFGVPAVIGFLAWGLLGITKRSPSFGDYYIVVWVAWVLGAAWRPLWWKAKASPVLKQCDNCGSVVIFGGKEEARL